MQPKYAATIDGAKTMAATQGATVTDYFAANPRHQTELTAIARPDGSFTICSDSFWQGRHEQGIAFDMTREQAVRLLNWLRPLIDGRNDGPQ